MNHDTSDRGETSDSENDEDILREEGNVKIIDETKVKDNILKDEAKTTYSDCDEVVCKLKGNINIIDDTKKESENKEKCEENCETDTKDNDEGREDAKEVQVKTCKEKEIITDSSEENDNSYRDSSATDSDHSLEKGNETMNETFHSGQTESEALNVNTNNLYQNDEQIKAKAAIKPGDTMLKIKTAVKSLQNALDILEKKDHPDKALHVNKSSRESAIQSETTKYSPFHVRQDNVPIKSETSEETSTAFVLVKASDIRSHPCNFCDCTAVFTCKSCKYFYCFKCSITIHPYQGIFKSHEVVPIIGGVAIEQYETCKDHGLVAQLFCSYCELKRCPECANTKCLLHFKGKVSRDDIDREKTQLVEEMEKATTKLSFLGRYKDFVENECDKIEMIGLLRKEQIRQEFVSFHDLLINKEAEMLEALDRNVQERMDHIRDTLQVHVQDLEREDALLTTTVTELVQTEDDAKFIEECVNAKELCSKVDDKMKAFNNDWAKNSRYSRSQILDNPFSMLHEKKQLHEKLGSVVSFVPEVTFVQTTMFLYADSGPLIISDFLQIPVAPPSTEVQYTLQVSTTHGKVVYEKETNDLKEISLNATDTVKFETGLRYLVKIIPTYKYTVNAFEHCLEKGNAAYMLIVVSRASKYRKNDVKEINRLRANQLSDVVRFHRHRQSKR